MGRVVIVSADGHVGTQPEVYRDYIDTEYRDAIDDLISENQEYLRLSSGISEFAPDVLEVIDDRQAIRSGGLAAGWDMERRLRELDAEGVAGEVVLSGTQTSTLPFFSVVNRRHPAELRWAGARAYHRWLAEQMQVGQGRLSAVADPGPCIDMKSTLAELKWVAEHGFVSVGVPGVIGDSSLPPLYDPYFEPFWAACSNLGLVLSTHAGWGQDQGGFFDFLEKLSVSGELDVDNQMAVLEEMSDELKSADDSPLALDIGPRRAMWLLMMSGVFDRHPELKLVLTEVRADWVPATLRYLDAWFDGSRSSAKKKPSEYWVSNCLATPSGIHISEIEMRHEIGVRQMMFGTDFPHPEGTWPNTQDWIRAAFADVPEDEARLMLGENAIACYHLDGAKLAAVAAEIGPELGEVLGGHVVDEAKIDHFHKRSRYRRPAEEIDTGQLDRALR